MIKATLQIGSYRTEMNFPCTEIELSKKLKELGMNGDELAPVGTIVMIEPMELSILEGQEVSLDALNLLGKQMSLMKDEEHNQFYAILSCGELGLEHDLKTAINVTYNLCRYTLVEDANDLKKAGLAHLRNISMLCYDENKDMERLIEEGRKLLDSGNGIQTKYGLIFVNEDSIFMENYKGKTLPFCYYDREAAVSVKIRYLDNIELVQLPNDDIAIKKALARLGAVSLNECYLEIHPYKDVFDDWRDKIVEFERSKSLFQLNALLKSEDICVMRGDFEKLFMKEISRKLEKSGYIFHNNDGAIIVNPYTDKKVRIRDNGVVYAENIFQQKSAAIYCKLSLLTHEVYECCVNFENSWSIDGHSEFYHGILEFNGIILAMTLDEDDGFEFHIFHRQSNGMCVHQRQCFDDYDLARELFALRSGIIDNSIRFNSRELENLQRSLNFTLKNGKSINSDIRDEMSELNEKISECIEEQQQSYSPTMSM